MQLLEYYMDGGRRLSITFFRFHAYLHVFFLLSASLVGHKAEHTILQIRCNFVSVQPTAKVFMTDAGSVSSFMQFTE